MIAIGARFSATPETGGEFCTSREEDSTNDPAADLAKMLTPSATEEPAEAMRPIMDRLTALKAESIAEADPSARAPQTAK